MQNHEGISRKRVYVVGALVFLVTAWFSVGYNHFDEHFQIIEFAGLKLGLTTAESLPWEYQCMMRPAFQPAVVFLINKFMFFTGVSNPFVISFIIRLFSASLTFLAIHLMIRRYTSEIGNQKFINAFLLLSFFLWFIPYNGARFSSDTTAGVLFVIGFAGFLLKDKPTPADYLITGLFLGLSFITKYQAAFMVMGFALWIILIRKSGFRNLFSFASGVILTIALGVLIDRWFYGEWVLTAVNYFNQNILLGKASGFGTYPWWYYFEQVFMNAIPPFSLVYILAVLVYFWRFPKDPITWSILPFLVVHFLVPHKEIRFLFPIILFLPVMIIRSADSLVQKKGVDLLAKRSVRISVKLFWYTNLLMLFVLAFRPADDQISLYKQLWSSYSTPVKLYYIDENPYHRAGVDIHYYKRANLVFEQIKTVQTIVSSKDTVCLVALTHPGIESGGSFFPQLIYSSLPPWVRKFNFNHWIERTSFWYIYELKPKPNQ